MLTVSKAVLQWVAGLRRKQTHWNLVAELKRAGEVGRSRLPDENAFETITFILERGFQLWRVAGHRGAMGRVWAPPVRAR